MGEQTKETSARSNAFEVRSYDAKGEEGGTDKIRFELDANGKPLKRGDGSFGVVYKGYGRGKSCAIKLLYDNSSISPRPLSELQRADREQIAQAVAKECNLDAAALSQAIEAHTDDPSKLAVAITHLVAQTRIGQAEGQTALAEQILESIHQKASSDAADRFRRERDVSLHLREKHGQDLSGTVEVWGGSDSFLKFLNDPTNASLKRYFEEEQKVVISNFALVMDLYDCSLKDLLEKDPQVLPLPNPSPRTKRGYDLLESLTLEQRIREALILLRDIVVGLMKLHNTTTNGQAFYHLDIKPGNVFMRMQPHTGWGFMGVLGDLGNLPPKPEVGLAPLNEKTAPPKPALGSPHYRSPEQKYHMDVAYVRVTHDVDASGGRGKVMLEVADPKFKTNLFEVDDYVVFSKDKARRKHFIVGKPVLSVGAGTDADDTALEDRSILKIELSTQSDDLIDEDRTQVEFHKQQKCRTDLFGIGAIAYDIITCGKSPEQFYESIRRFEGEEVRSIISRYENLRVGQADVDDPDLLQIFKPFRHLDGDFADERIVEFILKCMLYSSPDTFYLDDTPLGQAARVRPNTAEGADGLEESAVATTPSADDWNDAGREQIAIKRLLAYISDDSKLWRAYVTGADTKPALIYGKRDGSETVTDLEFLDTINRLQDLEPWPKDSPMGALVVAADGDAVNDAIVGGASLLRQANRLVLGSFYLLQLAMEVQNHFTAPSQTAHKSGGDPFSGKFLYQLLPEYIKLREQNATVNMSFSDPTYATREDYKTDLRQNHQGRMVRQPLNSFVPSRIASMRRELRLRRLQDEAATAGATAGTDSARFQYWARDHTALGGKIAPGDWLVFKKQLGEIIDVDEDALTVRWEDAASASQVIGADEWLDASCFANLDPIRYYLDMLGLYLQHLVFAHSPFTTSARNRLDARSLLRMLDVTQSVYLVAPNPPSAAANNGGVAPKQKAARAAAPALSSAADAGVAELKSIYTSYVHLLLKLTLHESEDSYYALMRGDDGDANVGARRVLNMVIRYARAQHERIMNWLGLPVQEQLNSQPDLCASLSDDVLQTLGAATRDRFDMERAIKHAQIIWVK